MASGNRPLAANRARSCCFGPEPAGRPTGRRVLGTDDALFLLPFGRPGRRLGADSTVVLVGAAGATD